MTLLEVLRALRKRWWIVVALVIVGCLGAMAVNARAERVYQARVTFFVSTPPTTNGTQALAGGEFVSNRVNSYVRLLSSDVTAQAVRDAGVDLPASTIRNSITGSANVNTVMLTATVHQPSRARALAIATAIGERFADVVRTVDAQARPTAEAEALPIQIAVVSGPSASAAPVSPRTRLNLMAGILASLVVGIGLALAREFADTSVRTVEDLQELDPAAVLGSIPYDRSARRAPAIVGERRGSPQAEAMRKLRTNVQFAAVETPLQVLAVTSSGSGEGKSSTVLNLGIVAAESDRRVLIIDADMRKPQIAAYAGVPGVIGLTDLLAGSALFVDVVQRWGDRGLDILPCGTIPPNPSELLGGAAMATLMAGLRARYDLILLDTPPLGPVTDAAVVAAHADGVGLVVRCRKTSRARVRNALRALRAVDARVAGMILTMTPARGADHDSDVYGYVKDSRAPWRRMFRRGGHRAPAVP